MGNKIITIAEENAKAAMNIADENTKAVLRKLFGFENETKDERTITERVTCWDDVLRELGENHSYVKSLPTFEKLSEDGDENALICHKLRMVCEALNEGWRPDYHNGEDRYYPCFYFYKTKEDAKKYAYDDEYVFEIPEPLRGCLWGGYEFGGSHAGPGFADTSACASPSDSAVYFGSRLCLKTRELALHAGKCFNELWLKYLLC